jgi:hypothetical protein
VEISRTNVVCYYLWFEAIFQRSESGLDPLCKHDNAHSDTNTMKNTDSSPGTLSYTIAPVFTTYVFISDNFWTGN